jgi:hypothetical protein
MTGLWIKRVSVNIEIGAFVQRDVVVLVDGAWRAAKELGIWTEGWMDVFDVAGRRLGNVAGLYALGQVIEERDDVTRKGFEIDGDPVQVEGFDGPVKIMGMQWEERKVTDTFPVVSEAKGTPRLVLQQLDENGERTAWQGDRRREIAGVEGKGRRAGRAGEPAGDRSVTRALSTPAM